MKLPELAALESFECEEVILKFSRDFGVALPESKMIFKETMKMLWLMVKHRQELENRSGCFLPNAFNVQKAMDPLDKMWHEFILFTQEYHDFCREFFGSYLHHVPCSEKEFRAFQQRKEERKSDFEERERQEIRTFVRYIQENLGTETLESWFKKIPEIQLT